MRRADMRVSMKDSILALEPGEHAIIAESIEVLVECLFDLAYMCQMVVRDEGGDVGSIRECGELREGLADVIARDGAMGLQDEDGEKDGVDFGDDG